MVKTASCFKGLNKTVKYIIIYKTCVYRQTENSKAEYKSFLLFDASIINILYC